MKRKDPHAVAMARKRWNKLTKAERAKALEALHSARWKKKTKKQKSEHARMMARARHHKKKSS